MGRGTEKEQRQRRGGSPVAGLGTASAPATRHEPFQGPSRQPHCEFCAAQSHRAGQGRGQMVPTLHSQELFFPGSSSHPSLPTRGPALSPPIPPSFPSHQGGQSSPAATAQPDFPRPRGPTPSDQGAARGHVSFSWKAKKDPGERERK